MKINTLIAHSAQLVGIIYKSSKPADKIASEYFRSKKYIGSKERKLVSELTFHSLRNYTLLSTIANHIINNNDNQLNSNENVSNELFIIATGIILWDKIDSDSQSNILMLFNIQHDENVEQLDTLVTNIMEADWKISNDLSQIIISSIISYFNNLNNSILEELEENELIEKLSIRFSINTFIIKSLLKYLTKIETIHLLDSLTKPAPLVIRINTISSDRESILNYFKNNNIISHKTELSPDGIILLNRLNLNNLDLFKNGIIEVQDEGSQIISFALSPEKKSRILDACAGAGGKTLHIACLTNNSAEICASDIDNRKLNEILKRSNRFGFKNINTVHINHSSSNKKNRNSLKGLFDYVLVDAPCSGSGTVRRMPLPKYRINENLIKRLSDNQFNILNYYSQFVKPGGILVYSTCSLLPQENQDVINKFLEQSDFIGSPLTDIFDRYGIKFNELNSDAFMLNLNPSRHSTDGFFIARLTKGIHERY